MEAWYIFPLMIAAGAFGGWAWAMIPALLKVKFQTNEILVSLMLVYVAEQLLASMSLGLLKNPDGHGFPGSRNLKDYPSAFNDEIITGSGMHWGVLTAFIAVIFAYILLNRHMLGFSIRLTGEAPRAAKFSSVNPTRLILFCLGMSGALAGLAGMFEVSGPAGQITLILTQATALQRSLSPSWGAYILSASFLQAFLWLSHISVVKLPKQIWAPGSRNSAVPRHAALFPTRRRFAHKL